MRVFNSVPRRFYRIGVDIGNRQIDGRRQKRNRQGERASRRPVNVKRTPAVIVVVDVHRFCNLNRVQFKSSVLKCNRRINRNRRLARCAFRRPDNLVSAVGFRNQSDRIPFLTTVDDKRQIPLILGYSVAQNAGIGTGVQRYGAGRSRGGDNSYPAMVRITRKRRNRRVVDSNIYIKIVTAGRKRSVKRKNARFVIDAVTRFNGNVAAVARRIRFNRIKRTVKTSRVSLKINIFYLGIALLSFVNKKIQLGIVQNRGRVVTLSRFRRY